MCEFISLIFHLPSTAAESFCGWLQTDVRKQQLCCLQKETVRLGDPEGASLQGLRVHRVCVRTPCLQGVALLCLQTPRAGGQGAMWQGELLCSAISHPLPRQFCLRHKHMLLFLSFPAASSTSLSLPCWISTSSSSHAALPSSTAASCSSVPVYTHGSQAQPGVMQGLTAKHVVQLTAWPEASHSPTADA